MDFSQEKVARKKRSLRGELRGIGKLNARTFNFISDQTLFEELD